MAADNPTAPSESVTGSSADTAAWPPQNLRNLWQIPAIAASAILIGAALWSVSRSAPGNDFDGVLDETRELIAAGRLDDASDRLQNVLFPNLDLAGPGHVARFHALAADWLDASQVNQNAIDETWTDRITKEYALADEGGLLLNVPRRLRWGRALLELGRLEEARVQLDALDGLSGEPEQRDAALRAHNELLRGIVEASLVAPPPTGAFAQSAERAAFERNMALLTDYRANAAIGLADEAWAIAREAELRLRAAEFNAAIDHLQVDMRRLERRYEREGAGELSAFNDPWGELYTLLGRAYVEHGDFDRGEFHLKAAMDRFAPDDPGRRDALLQLAIIDTSRNEYESALERLDEIIGGLVLDHTDEPWYLPALLQSAELLSRLGRHEESLERFSQLVDLMKNRRQAGRIDADRVADSLVDRLESAIMQGNLELGLEYAARAEPLFERARVPAPLLERIAATNRQIADNIMAAARARLGDYADRIDLVPVAERAEANRRYLLAGEYFRRHAQAIGGTVEGEDDAENASYFRAGDSYDLGGDRDGAIAMFAAVPGADLHWPEAKLRLGLAYMARGDQGDLEKAVAAFEDLQTNHPTTTFATHSLVPHANALVELGHVAEARDMLLAVVDGYAGTEDGADVLEPGNPDYRAALVAVGRLYHDESNFVKAIEYLDAAVPELAADPSALLEVRYRLADAHRQAARAEADLLASGPHLSNTEQDAADARRRAHIETAQALYGLVVDGYTQMDPRMLDAMQRDFSRNAAMARADCAYDLGDFELALTRYDEVARRYHDHYASMHAMVQIVNCYMNASDRSRARIAHDKAMRQLEQLPDTAFDDPRAILDRGAWEEWLRNMPIAKVAAGSVGGPTP